MMMRGRILTLSRTLVSAPEGVEVAEEKKQRLCVRMF